MRKCEVLVSGVNGRTELFCVSFCPTGAHRRVFSAHRNESRVGSRHFSEADQKFCKIWIHVLASQRSDTTVWARLELEFLLMLFKALYNLEVELKTYWKRNNHIVHTCVVDGVRLNACVLWNKTTFFRFSWCAKLWMQLRAFFWRHQYSAKVPVKAPVRRVWELDVRTLGPRMTLSWDYRHLI